VEKRELIEKCRENDVKFVRLVFTELYGHLRNVSIPVEELDKALNNELMFDGSSIRGYKRIEQSDMYFHPDPDTFAVLPWRGRETGQVARIICDAADPDGTPFAGDPRVQLKKVLADAKADGYDMACGPEAEFFLFRRDSDGDPTIDPHDVAGYFDVGPLDLGEDTRRDIEDTLVKMDFHLEASHHEVAVGQHEIDFRYCDALTGADASVTLRFALKSIAAQHGLHATFMPKPIAGINGSGMHVHQSLFTTDGKNLMFDKDGLYSLSDFAEHFIGGQLHHIKAMNAILNPTINSYKRLVVGYEAPVNVAWGQKNRSVLIRVPRYTPGREKAVRVEIRCPDPAANPYLAFAVLLAAGLDGVEKKIKPPKPVEDDIFEMGPEEIKERGIGAVAENLKEALEELSINTVVREAIGEFTFRKFYEAKMNEWDEYRIAVSQWELDRYMEIH
jgi:glutamine synthetase